MWEVLGSPTTWSNAQFLLSHCVCTLINKQQEKTWNPISLLFPTARQSPELLGFKCSQLLEHGGWYQGSQRLPPPPKLFSTPHTNAAGQGVLSWGVEQWKLLPPTAFASNFPLCGFCCVVPLIKEQKQHKCYQPSSKTPPFKTHAVPAEQWFTMFSKLGHSPPRGFSAWLALPACLLCQRLRARGEREMGNSMRSTQAPPERPLSGPSGKSGFFSVMLNSLLWIQGEDWVLWFRGGKSWSLLTTGEKWA